MFPFKYKLTLIIGFVVMLLTGGILFMLMNSLEKNFSARVNTDLKRTGNLVETLMDLRYERLLDAGNLMADQELFRQILIDRSLDRITRNDIVQNEVSGDFPDVDTIIVANGAGEFIAANKRGEDIIAALSKTEMFDAALEGRGSERALYVDGACIQMLSIPMFIGESMLGIVFVGMELDTVFVEEVRDMTGVDLCFLLNQRIFLSSFNEGQGHDNDLLASFGSEIYEQYVPGQVATFVAPANEPFLFTMQPGTASSFVPAYAIMKSKKDDLLFIQTLAQSGIIIGLGGILLAMLISFLFSLGVTRPIETLIDALEEVDHGHYEKSIEISSKDEFATLADAYNKMIHGLAERERIRGVMNKVVSKDIAEEMLAGRIELGGEERVGTVLFSDIRQFTPLSEGLSPTDLLASLNKYFTSMSSCIDQHGGVIDKYIGDAIMALFGLPVDRGRSAENAIRAALDMTKALDDFNNDNSRPFGRDLHMGIGINTGRLVAGNMGAEDRLNYSVLGDQVNLAARVEGLTVHYRVNILVSGACYDAIDEEELKNEGIYFRELDLVQVKGKTTGSRLFEVLRGFDGIADKLVLFNRARQDLLDGKFQDAYEAFSRLRKEWPEDGPTEVFLRRAESYNQDPDAFKRDYSDRVFVFTSK